MKQIIDNSYIELYELLAKPLTEDFRWPWSYLRVFFWGLLPLAIVSFLMGYLMENTVQYTNIKDFFFNLSLISGSIVVFIYIVCGFHAYQVHCQRKATKELRGRKFQD